MLVFTFEMLDFKNFDDLFQLIKVFFFIYFIIIFFLKCLEGRNFRARDVFSIVSYLGNHKWS